MGQPSRGGVLGELGVRVHVCAGLCTLVFRISLAAILQSDRTWSCSSP